MTPAKEKLSDSRREILEAIRRLLRAIRISSRQAEREFGLSGAQLLILQLLSRGHAFSINQLAEQTHTHQSSVSAVVTRLESDGLIERTTDPEDARKSLISLSLRGAKVVQQKPVLAQERLLSAIDSFSAPERARLAELLTLIVERAGFAGESPTLFFEDESPKP